MFLFLFIPPSGQHATNARTSLMATDQVSRVQAVRMKGIQNIILISQKAFIIHIYGLHNYKGKLSKVFFSEYISKKTNVGSLGGTTNIQTIFDLVPRCFKHVWCYRSNSVPYADFQVLTLTW
jgi:hypothetical protein